MLNTVLAPTLTFHSITLPINLHNQHKSPVMSLPAAAASSWSLSSNNSHATGIISIKLSSDKIGAAFVITDSGLWVRFWA